MYRNKLSKVICIVIVLAMALTALTACGGNNGSKEATTQAGNESTAGATSTEASKQPEPLLEYSFYVVTDAPPTYVDESTDVITPIVEEKFNVKVKETMYNQGVSFKEKFNLLLASGELPDVIYTWSADAITVAASGKYAELGDMIKANMPNYTKAFPESMWNEYQYQGKTYSVSGIDQTLYNDYSKDIYVNDTGCWTYWTRESILKKLGYSFTPMKEIEKKINETQVKPTVEDFKVEPAITTYDDFYNYLKKIKDANIKVNGKDVIPFTTVAPLLVHFGCGFGVTGYWQNDGDNGWNGWLGSPNAKEYFKWFNKAFNEKLIDQQFLIQKPEQMQEKATQGLIASGMWMPDINQIRDSIKKLDPEDELRPMLIPREPGKKMPIDHTTPGFSQYFIKKDFKDIPRLLKYFDWFYTDEAADLNTWGPESKGVWEMKDGKKVFKDNAVLESLKKGEKQKGTLAFDKYSSYGIGGIGLNAMSKAFYAAPFKLPNMSDYTRSYPYTVTDIYGLAWATLTKENLDAKGEILPGFDTLTTGPATYWSTVFNSNKSVLLIAAKDDATYEKNWNEVYNDFVKQSKYEEAKKAFGDAKK